MKNLTVDKKVDKIERVIGRKYIENHCISLPETKITMIIYFSIIYQH